MKRVESYSSHSGNSHYHFAIFRSQRGAYSFEESDEMMSIDVA